MSERERVDEVLLAGWQQNREISSILRVGSSVRDYVKMPNDLDYLVVMDQPPTSANVCALLGELANADNAWVNTYDSWRSSYCGTAIGIAFVHEEEFRWRVEETCQGKCPTPNYVTWSLAGDAPEVLCADLHDARVLLDRSGAIATLRELAANYPSALKESILEYCEGEIRQKIAMATSTNAPGDEFVRIIAIAGLVFPTFRAASAHAQIYFRGMKHLHEFTAYYLPHRLELLDAVQASLVSREGLLKPAVHSLEKLLRDISAAQDMEM